jgi:hypothetical protein
VNFLKPNFKNAAIVTTIIFAQKIYRHPDEFAFVYNEGLYKEFSKHLKGHKVLKDNYLMVVKEIKRASSK